MVFHGKVQLSCERPSSSSSTATWMFEQDIRHVGDAKNMTLHICLQLFAASGLELRDLAKDETLSNGMGLFLQKTNIIRDYLEDIEELPAPRYS